MTDLSRHRWWLVRCARLPVDLLVFATLAFLLVRLLPGDPVANAAAASGENLTPEAMARLRADMGLDGSLPAQLGEFWRGLFTLDLGSSLSSGMPVTEEVLTRLPATLELVLLGLLGCLVLTTALGICYVRSRSDGVRSWIRAYGATADGLPVFVVAVFGIVVFYVLLNWAPPPLGRTAGPALPVVTGFPLLDELLTGRFTLFAQTVARYVLPVSAIALVNTPNLLVQLTSALDVEVGRTTTRFQVAAGARRRAIHLSVFRRSAASVVVVFGMMFGGMLGGAVTLEQLFGFGGVGQLALRAVDTVDFPMLQGFLILVVAACLLVYFAVDVVTMLLDPRRRPGVAAEET